MTKKAVQAYRSRDLRPTAQNPYPTVNLGAAAYRTAEARAEGAPTVAPIEVVASPRPKPSFLQRDPGLAESLIPFWGPGRGLVADLHQGDYAGAALNAAMLGADAFGVGLIGRGVKLGRAIMPGGKQGWKYVQQVYKKKGYLPEGEQGHHAIIENNSWLGKRTPNWVKNHPLNIQPLPPEKHMPIHQSSKNYGPQFNHAQRYWHGRPTWAKVVDGTFAGRPVEALRDRE